MAKTSGGREKGSEKASMVVQLRTGGTRSRRHRAAPLRKPRSLRATARADLLHPSASRHRKRALDAPALSAAERTRARASSARTSPRRSTVHAALHG
eukprot:6212174-Pleurochrysis_carterae.AAC.3